jgi:hypothetical protein
VHLTGKVPGSTATLECLRNHHLSLCSFYELPILISSNKFTCLTYTGNVCDARVNSVLQEHAFLLQQRFKIKAAEELAGSLDTDKTLRVLYNFWDRSLGYSSQILLPIMVE